MTAAELQRIEQELGASLPADYKAIMRDYPFGTDSIIAELWLCNDAEWVKDHSKHDDSLPPHSFIIGCDGGEEIYFIDRSRNSTPVFVYDYETGKVVEKAPNVSAYVEQCKLLEDDLRRDEEEMARKKWWQFWR